MFLNTLEQIFHDNKQEIELDHAEDLNLIRSTISMQMELLNLYLLVLKHEPYVDADNYSNLVFTAIFKNYLSLYSALDLTSRGLYGSARIIFRNIYEFLIISKTVAINKDTSLLKKWENGDDIYLKRDIFSKVKKPKSEEMKEFWEALCKFTHGSIHAVQVDLLYKRIKNEIQFNFVCIKMLIDMNYHTMNSFAANRSIQYYTKFATDLKEANFLKERKKQIRNQINAMRRTLQVEPKKVVTDFTAKWEIS